MLIISSTDPALIAFKNSTLKLGILESKIQLIAPYSIQEATVTDDIALKKPASSADHTAAFIGKPFCALIHLFTSNCETTLPTVLLASRLKAFKNLPPATGSLPIACINVLGK